MNEPQSVPTPTIFGGAPPPAIPPMPTVLPDGSIIVPTATTTHNPTESAMAIAATTEAMTATYATEADYTQQHQHQQQQQYESATSSSSTKLIPLSINFESIFNELQAWKTQQEEQSKQTNSTTTTTNDSSSSSSTNLTIPTSHAAMSRITDILTSTGFANLIHQRWETQFASLQTYKLQHGNCNVPPNHNNNNTTTHPNNPTLYQWVQTQRHHYKLYEQRRPSPLTPTQYTLLKSLSLTSNLWEKRLHELRLYKEQHGHCDVPIDYPKLGVWVLNQRDTFHFSKNSMDAERIASLEELGFNWNRWGRNRLKIREDAWDAQFGKLLEFMKLHGHSNISQHDKENERLGKWIKNQRYEYRKYHNKGLGPSRLGRDRIDKLNEIGFQWRLRPERIPWDDRFKALVEYKEIHGHCRIAMSAGDLGRWAKYQRDQYCLFMRGKKAKINQEKVDRLIGIGFEDSLEERVALGLNVEGGDGTGVGGEQQQQHHHHPQQQQQHHVVVVMDHSQQQQHHDPAAVAAAPVEVTAYHHHEQTTATTTVPVHHQAYGTEQQYHHHADPNAAVAYGTATTVQQQDQQQGAETFHYQHGGVHYHGA